MKKYNLKRFLASLLAVLMLASVTGVSPAVFADWGSNVSLTAAKATDKRLELNGDKEIRIPYKDNGDIDFDALYPLIFETCVNKSKSALQSYDKDKIDIEQQQKVCHKLEGDSFCDPIKEDQTYTIKFTYHYGSHLWEKTEQSCKITFLGREALPAVAEKITVAATFTDDLKIKYDNLRSAIWTEVSKDLPAGVVKQADVTFEYKYDGKWYAFEGSDGTLGFGKAPALGLGENEVKLTWNGNKDYKKWEPTITVNVEDGREPIAISFKDAPSIDLTFDKEGKIDYTALKEAIWANVVESVTPAEMKDKITVKYGSDNIDSNPAIAEGEGTLTFTYAGDSRYRNYTDNVTVNFKDNRAPVFELKTELPGTLKIGYVGDDIDAAKTEENVRNQLVQKAENGDLELDNVKVEFKSVTGDYTALTVAGIKAHKVGATEALDKLVTPANIRLSYAGDATHKAFNVIVDTLKFDDYRVASSIVLKENASITYNKEKGAMKQDIFDNLIDWDASNIDKSTVSISDFEFECQSFAIWKDIDGKEYPNLDAGDAQKIRISFVGNSDFKPGEFEFTIKVAKAHVDVSMNAFTKAYAGNEDDLTIEKLGITLNPDDQRIDIYRVFVGINTNLKASVNLALTDEQWEFIEKVSKAQELLYEKAPNLFPSFNETIQDKLEKGMTIAEFKEYMNNAITAIDNAANDETWGPIVQKGLDLFHIDLEAIKALASVFDVLTMVSDDLTIAVGVPEHAGLYRVYAIAANKNYETNYATGTVLILMNWKDIKIVPNADLKKQTITVSEANEYADGTKAAATLLNEKTDESSGIDQSALHYRFTGLNKIYSSHDFPTAPGKYIVTVSVRGGDYYALPTTFTFTVKAD